MASNDRQGIASCPAVERDEQSCPAPRIIAEQRVLSGPNPDLVEAAARSIPLYRSGPLNVEWCNQPAVPYLQQTLGERHANFFVHEGREIWSPRGEGSLSTFCHGGDGHRAD